MYSVHCAIARFAPATDITHGYRDAAMCSGQEPTKTDFGESLHNLVSSIGQARTYG